MLNWIPPRRLGAAAVLYAVFVSGWYLGQPLPAVGCHTAESETVAEDLATVGEPGDVTSDLTRTARVVVTDRLFTTDVIVECDGASHPRLLAWVAGDWR
ncbi:hypothetical protein AB0N50_08820 [Streptomyces pharetrae]|uniref:hypothetical protein n=1 Tax=Streptomyces pharetrae TaxID=291370 RepID=UPI00345F2D3B